MVVVVASSYTKRHEIISFWDFIAKLGAIFRWSFVRLLSANVPTNSTYGKLCTDEMSAEIRAPDRKWVKERERKNHEILLWYSGSNKNSEQARFRIECVVETRYFMYYNMSERNERNVWTSEQISPFNLVFSSPFRVRLRICRKRKNVVMVIIRLVLLLKYTGILKLLSSLSCERMSLVV